MQFVIVQHSDIELVRRYLPTNYFVFFARGNHIVVAGEDDHGWTATGYVIPRLASGMIASYLITPKDYADKYMDAPPVSPITMRILEALNKEPQ